MFGAAHPIISYTLGLYGNATIAASALGTAAATVITSSVSVVYAKSFEIWNFTGSDLDLVIGADNGTATYSNATPSAGTNIWTVANGTFFLPSNRGTAAMAQIRGERTPIKLDQGMSISIRTTNNTPVTCSAAAPIIINFWT